MADTLRYLAEARALIPDNAQQLVSPKDVREYLLALEPDRGGYFLPSASGPVVVSLPAAGTWVELNSTTIPGMVGTPNALRWSNDGLARPIPAWGSEVTVPAGHRRSSFVTGIISADPVENNDDSWQVVGGVNGVPEEDQAETFKISENGEIATITHVGFLSTAQDGSEYLSLFLRNLDAARNMNLYSGGLVVQGYAYEEAPI
jgi:hypothetical protein